MALTENFPPPGAPEPYLSLTDGVNFDIVAFCFSNAFEAGKIVGSLMNWEHFGIREIQYLSSTDKGEGIRSSWDFGDDGELRESAKEIIALLTVDIAGNEKWRLVHPGQWLVLSHNFAGFSICTDLVFRKTYRKVVLS